MKSNLCPACKERPKQKHRNSKRCLPCALHLRKRPKGTLTTEQKSWIKSRIGKMPISQMAEHLETSVSNIKRSLPGVAIWFRNGKYKYRPALIRRVLDYYSAHGNAATRKAFPDVNVRSLVERHNYYGVAMKPRQIRWKESELILAAKMAGLVEARRQARIFNRPRANEGSIRSLWVKRFGHGGGNIHGMSQWMAKELLRSGYPVIKTRMWSPRKRKTKQRFERGIVLWVDMEKHLKRGTPEFIRDAISAMAHFQRWLFESKNPRREIQKMVNDRNWRPSE